MKLLVVGSLNNVPSQPDLCAPFVSRLGEQIVERGHTLLNGCRGSLDKAIAEAADARLRALGRKPESQLLGYRLKEAEPVHRLGIIRISERTDWDLTYPELMPPEQIGEADAAIFVAGETMVRLQPVAGVPPNRPALNIRRLSGEKGSVSGGTRSHNILAFVPSPPR